MLCVVVVGTHVHHVANSQPPTGEGTSFGFDDEAGMPHGHADSLPSHLHGLHHGALGVQERNVDRELHADGVHPTARRQHDGAIEVITAKQPFTSTGPVVGHFR